MMTSTIHECLKHFFGFCRTKANEHILSRMLNLLAVDATVSADWIEGRILPEPEDMLRFQCILRSVGYQFPGSKRVSKLFDELEKQLLVREISITDVAWYLNLSKNKTIRITTNRSDLSETKDSLLRGLLLQRFNATQEKFIAWQEVIDSWKIAISQTPAPESQKPAHVSNQDTRHKGEDMKGMKGSTEECLKHFSERNDLGSSSKEVLAIRNSISELLNVSLHTGYQWFSNNRMPGGENLLRLRLFLALNDYEVTDRLESSSKIQELIDQVALGVTQISEVAKYLDITEDTVGRIMHNRISIMPKHDSKIVELAEYYHDDAEKKKQEWIAKIKAMGIKHPNAASTSELPLPKAKSECKNGTLTTVKVLAHLIEATIPLAKDVLSDDFSAEDRRELRELTNNRGSNGVFDLSNLLIRLCGERARKEFSSQQTQDTKGQ